MAMTLITTNTSSGAATSDFTSSIDNTYKLYIFKFYDVNPATDGADIHFLWQANAAGGSGFDETITSTFFRAYHDEADSGTSLDYNEGSDQAQGTAYQRLGYSIGGASDESIAGELYLFNPSNTTYAKHFYSTVSWYGQGDWAYHGFSAGYINTTSAIDEVSFKMISGNMDAVIKMYGVG